MNLYEKFIEKYRWQKLDNMVYKERHHIIPKHIGGSNNEDNIITLTYRQHILAHLLLYRVYRRFEDLTAYRLMRGLDENRKVSIGKLIGQRHKDSGHIYELGRRNVESGFLESIRTKEISSKGGKIGGAIARNTGQIRSIRTDEGSRLGGEIAGKYASERGQIQKLGKYKGLYVLISPEGVEFQHIFQMSEALGIHGDKLIDWCRNNRFGYSRRNKTQEELDKRWTTLN